MVCLGNICRSPMAEGVLRHYAEKKGLKITIDSAGTARYHVGQAPDRRAVATMKGHGMDISGLRGRQVSRSDFDRFDLLLAMDEDNAAELMILAPDETSRAKVRLIMAHVPDHDLRSVPDPYYGGPDDFEQVHAMLVEACQAIIDGIGHE